jgi:acyl-CoA thioesterase FadM
MSHLGLGPSWIRERAMSFAVVSAESKFIRELAPGDVVRLLSSVDAIGNKSATFNHQLENLETRMTVFETQFKCVLLDLDARVACEIPQDIRLALEALASPAG